VHVCAHSHAALQLETAANTLGTEHRRLCQRPCGNVVDTRASEDAAMQHVALHHPSLPLSLPARGVSVGAAAIGVVPRSPRLASGLARV
jgi:hypothetical protein